MFTGQFFLEIYLNIQGANTKKKYIYIYLYFLSNIDNELVTFQFGTMSKYNQFFLVGWLPYDDKFRVIFRQVQEVTKNFFFYLGFLTSISSKSSCMLSENFYHDPFLSSSSPKFDKL